MKTLTTLTNLFTSLSNNTSTANQTLGQQLMNDAHRYLLQKYFDNERTVQTTTVGGMSLTTIGTLALNATSAALTISWAYPTCTQLVTFSNGNQRSVLFTNGSTAITWTGGLTSSATSAISSVGVQGYNIPANVSKVKDFTINVGQLKYLPVEIQSRREWDVVNYLPYTSDIPNYFFIYNGLANIFPIPSTTGNLITCNFKEKVPDLTFTDYSTGNVTGMTAGSTAVIGTATSWSATGKYPLNTDVSFYNLFLRVDPPFGDGIWYPISQFTSDTALTLALPVVNAPNITAGSTYTIGQMPLLEEDFADMIVYRALMTYFTTIVDEPNKLKAMQMLYEERKQMLEDYLGTKTAMSVDLGGTPALVNPNLFLFGPTSTP